MKSLERLRAASLVVVAVVSIFASMPAYAHGDDDSAEHAAEDLVGVPMSTIEKQTNANKQLVLQKKGYTPGATTNKNGQSVVEVTPSAASSDPGMVGSWSSVIDTPIIPIFQAVLPNGKVLMWDSADDNGNAAENYPIHDHTRAMVWDPTENAGKRVDVQGYNIFCAGFVHMADGNILVAGGNKDQTLAGIVQTHIFDWRTETWSRGKDMASARWYPSLATMANGEQAIVGGGASVMEVYQANGTLRRAAGFTNTTYGKRIYPFMTSRPDTLLQMIGPYTTMYTIDIAGTGSMLATATRDKIDRQYGSFATYDIGKTLVIGGGSVTEDGKKSVPTKTAVIVNTNTKLAPTISTTSSMSVGRRQHNASVLADGSVLVTGGMTSAATSDTVDLIHAISSAERWDPITGKWTVLSSASRIREYHSTAALLPDGRVVTGGGGVCGVCVRQGYLEKNIEYFTPPYLYRKDGSGQLATRPVISAAPEIMTINSSFSVSSDQAASIRKVGLVGLPDVTHSVDQSQRYIPLKFTTAGTVLTVSSPTNGGIAPPGYYMLFITNADGVPSVARIVQVSKMANPVMSAVKNTAGKLCAEVPGASLKTKTNLRTYTCNNTKAQTITYLPTDSSLRVLGLCLDVANANFKSGQTIRTYTCNSSQAQQWVVQSDGTIRPKAKSGLCLAAASASNKAAVKIETCKSSALQKWTW